MMRAGWFLIVLGLLAGCPEDPSSRDDPDPRPRPMPDGGVIDGPGGPGAVADLLPFKLVEKSNFATIIPGALTNSILTLAINEDRWKSLSQADRDAISKISGEVFARNIGLAYIAGNEATWEAMRKAGKSIETASPAMVAEMKQLLKPMEASWAERARKRGAAQPEQLLEALRAEVAAVEAGR